MTTILGIDPGTRVVGWAVLETDGKTFRPIEFGALNVSRVKPFSERLRRIYEGLDEIITRFAPGEAVFEQVFAGRNPSSAIKMGEGRGVAVVCAANRGVPVYEYAPREVKKAVVGRGGASKEQVQEMVRRLLGLAEPPRPDDAADALAMALCRANRMLYGESRART